MSRQGRAHDIPNAPLGINPMGHNLSQQKTFSVHSSDILFQDLKNKRRQLIQQRKHALMHFPESHGRDKSSLIPNMYFSFFA